MRLRWDGVEGDISVRKSVTIALDAMGGDVGPAVTIPAALRVLDKHPGLTIQAFGVGEQIHPVLSSAVRSLQVGSSVRERLSIVEASEVVAMDEQPSVALRNKKNSSMRLSINAVKDGRASAAVSAGNTGALMAISKFVLKTLPGVSRPAIVTTIPCCDGHFYMLDLGANVDCDAEQLYQFALMGSVVASVMDGIAEPRVGLLNIGEEVIKGNEQVKQANVIMSRSKHIHYVGYVEGDSVFEHVADVVVCDGFVGNVALKSIEGVVKLVSGFVKEAVKSNWGLKAAAMVALPFSGALKQQLDPSQHNGAGLVGLRGSVVKSHGGTDEKGFARAIEVAYEQARLGLPDLIAKHFEVRESELDVVELS
ncbi:MAG: phosphate acyltransferase PlsX [Gammaproteobacteria bacterium]